MHPRSGAVTGLDDLPRRDARARTTMSPLRRIRPLRDPPPVLPSGRQRRGLGGPGVAAGPRGARAGGARPASSTATLTGQAALRPQGEARHLSAHGRRAVADGPVRLQAGDERVVRQGPARLDPHGPAAHHDDQRPEAVPDRPVEVQVRPARRVRACGSRELLPHTAKMVDDMCFIRSMHTEAINHEPAITLHADRQPGHRPALPGLVGLATAWAR